MTHEHLVGVVVDTTPMRCCLFIVTYRSPKALAANLASLMAGPRPAEVYIINNHTEFDLAPEHAPHVRVLHNTLRPDHSTGHLARDWNAALLHGFGSVSSPAAEIVLHAQDDVEWAPGWWQYIRDMHERFSFITMGAGDAFCSYRVEAVRRIGLWDERFCGIGYQEADYFTRAMLYNREASSINDHMHHRALNADPQSYGEARGELGRERVAGHPRVLTCPARDETRQAEHLRSAHHHEVSRNVYRAKWGINPEHWTPRLLHNPPQPRVASFMTYPWFERDVETLSAQNYLGH